MSVLHMHGSEGVSTSDTNRLTSDTERSESMREVIQNVEKLKAPFDVTMENFLQDASHTIFEVMKFTSRFSVLVENFMSNLSDKLVSLCGRLC